MNRSHQDFSARQASASLPEPDITHEVNNALRAMIVILAILMTVVLAGAAIKPLAHWIALN